MPQVALPGVISSVSVRLLLLSCHRTATELAPKTRKPGLSDRVINSRFWLPEAERGGFEPPVLVDPR